MLEYMLFERFVSKLSVSVNRGDIVVLEPPCFGGKVDTIPYKVSKVRREENMAQLKIGMHNLDQYNGADD